jgi:hypothetical protein
MPLSSYIPRLRHFSYGTGTAGLIDAIVAANWTEQGTVGLNSADGPPPELTGDSRGPCDSTTTGFARTPDSGSDYLDLRSTTDISMFAWARLDSRSTSQELFGWYTTTANEQALLYRYDHAFETPIGVFVGNTSTISTGPGAINLWQDTGADAWHFCGWSYSTATDKITMVFDDNKLTHASLFGNFANTVLTPARLGVTVSGVSGSGLKGDFAYFNVFDYAFDTQDWEWFYNGGAGRPYPSGYQRSGSIDYYTHAARAKRNG